MSELFGQYLPVLIAALIIGAIVGYRMIRPRQRVRLSDTTPTRPHMTAPADKPAPAPAPVVHHREGRGVADEAATALSDVSTDILRTQHPEDLPGTADDLKRLKGVGPKFATLLHSQGIFRFEQIAKLTPTEVDRIDAAMGSFRGRFKRDRIVEQADYLARGDEDGYEQKFGKL